MKTINVDHVLTNWISLLEHLPQLTESDCDALIEAELAAPTGAREQFLMRLHSRKNKLRFKRERKELMGRM